MRKIIAAALIAVFLFCAVSFAFSEQADNGDEWEDVPETAGEFADDTGETAGNTDEEASREAAEIKSGISFSANGRSENYEDMQDDDFRTYFPLKDKKGWLEVQTEEPVRGIYIMLFEKITVPLEYEIQVQDETGEWQTAGQGGRYLINWHPLEKSVTAFRILGTGRERIRISELRLYGEGEKPREVQDWQTIGKCDMMLISGHPDDEILWFAGLLPTYAGDRGLRVQLAVMAPTGGERKLELLHAIWHCGVNAYPEFIGLVDKNGKTVEGQYTAWKGKNRVQGLVTEVIRKHQPEVIVTHGENGEYGHGAHKTACACAKDCVKLASKANRFPKSAKQYGTWQVKKLYLHEYRKNIIPCDWTLPLEAFDGKTGYEVASEAFQYHRSQIRRNWGLDPDGSVHNNAGPLEHDNSLFGLFYTTVGQDTGIGDFMEHITTEKTGDE